MHYKKIEQLQKDYGFKEAQDLINSGHAWTMEGSVGRDCMGTLNQGATMLPKESKSSAYGNTTPSRDDVKVGTKGSFKACSDFWDKVESGEKII